MSKKMEYDEIKEAKESLRQYIAHKKKLSGSDVVEYLKDLKRAKKEEYLYYLELLDPESLAQAAVEMPDHMLEDVLLHIPKTYIVKALEELESDEQFELFGYLKDIDETRAKEIFKGLDKEDQEDILKISKYNDDEVGAYMQTEMFSAEANETLREAIDRLRDLRHQDEIEHVYQLFCVDKNNKLKYSIPLSDLIIYNYSLTIGEVVRIAGEDNFKPIFSYDTDSIDSAVIKFREFDLSVLPIINKDGVLVGRITAESVHDLIQDKATDQIYGFVGVDEDVELEETVTKAAKSRAFWLLINLVTSLISATVISLFSGEIEKLVALAALMPIVASMGGNTGSQALAVTVRRLALGQIEFRDAKEVILREIGISLINGIIFAIALGLIAYFWFKIPLLGVVIAISMVINLGIAGLIGTFVPLTLKSFGVDPAVGSSVLLTATTDALGFFCFLGLAKWILL